MVIMDTDIPVPTTTEATITVITGDPTGIMVDTTDTIMAITIMVTPVITAGDTTGTMDQASEFKPAALDFISARSSLKTYRIATFLCAGDVNSIFIREMRSSRAHGRANCSGAGWSTARVKVASLTSQRWIVAKFFYALSVPASQHRLII